MDQLLPASLSDTSVVVDRLGEWISPDSLSTSVAITCRALENHDKASQTHFLVDG